MKPFELFDWRNLASGLYSGGRGGLFTKTEKQRRIGEKGEKEKQEGKGTKREKCE